MIRFPHLGITLSHVPQSFSIGGLEIALYGVVLAIAMTTGLFLVRKIADRTGQNGEDYFDLGMIAIVVAVICARIYYVVFSWSYYSEHIWEIFNLRQGGLAIYGGIIGGVLTVYVFCRVRKLPYLRVLDTAAPGLVWGQMIGRWGNFFNREAFGEYTDGLLAMQLPAADVRSGEITEQMQEHLRMIDGMPCIQVHPTFLYESLWNLGVFLILLYLIFRAKRRYDGQVLLYYLFLYGIGRFWIEGLRTDQLLLAGTGIPVSQLLSAVLAVTAGILLLKNAKKR